MIVRKAPWIRKWLPVLVAVVAVRFAWIPFSSWQDEKKSNIALLQKGLSRMKSLQENGTELTAKLAETDKYMQAMQDRFHPDVTTTEALQLKVQKSLEELAGKTGLNVQRMEWLYVNSSEALVQIPIQIVFQSDVLQFYNFVYTIESLPQFFSVDRIELMKQKGQKLRGTMEISAYNLPPPSKADVPEKTKRKKRPQEGNPDS